MTGNQPPTTVVTYLRELDVVGRGLPQSVRVDLRARIVRELVAKLGAEPGEAEVAAALADLGAPAELVAAERERYNLAADPLLPRDVAAVYLLASGPFLLGLGIVCGLVLLWTSRRRPQRQRWIATGLFMVGAAVPLALPLALPLAVPMLDPLVTLLVGVLVVGPWSATAYLAALRCGRRIRAARQVERQGAM